MRIKIDVDDVSMEAVLDDTETARAIYDQLPVKNQALTWGDEIYFEVPVAQTEDLTARQLVEAGELAYWPVGRMFCVFFGPTPVSGPGEIRAASEVNILGRVEGDPLVFKKVQAGTIVTLSRIE